MREFLVTKLVCSKCGDNLQLTYNVPNGAGPHSDGEPTGAAMVQIRVAVEPCQCVVRRIARAQAAVRELLSIGEVTP